MSWIKSGVLFEFGEDEFGDFLESVEDALAGDGDGFESGLTFDIQLLLEIGDGKNVGEIAFIELQDVGNRREIEIVILQVLAQVIERFEIGVEALFLGIRDKDNSIGALENQAAAGFVKDLAGNGVKVKAGLESADGAEVERKKIEEKSAIGFRGERNHLSLLIRTSMLVDPLQVGGLSAETRAVIHKLAVDLASGKINKRHDFLRV